MVKEIKYTGFTASPSDYECPDGDLAAVLNVVPEEGSLSPVLPPRQLFQLSDGGDVRFVHETSYIRNFIILHPDNSITWRTEEDPDQYSHGTLSHSFSGHTIHQINAIGNTLIVLADDGMHYFLWKGYRNGSEKEGDEPKEYLYLGTHLPELSISFGLQGEIVVERHRDSTKVSASDINDIFGTDYVDGDGHFVSAPLDIFEKYITKKVKAKVNKFINQNSFVKGKFLFPFFVRYAYRLYDGNSLTMHSAPILMMCSYPQSILFQAVLEYDGDYVSKIMESACYGMFHKLDYSVISDISDLNNWKDIIRSVDIFVSQPIYTYDQDGEEYVKLKSGSTLHYSSICKYNGIYSNFGDLIYSSTNQNYQKHDIFDLLEQHNENIWTDFFELPIISNSTVNSEISERNLFYKVHSINIEDLKTERTVIDIDTSQLKNLGTGEYMVDDYQTHDLLIPKYSYGYNARFNITDLKMRLFNGYNPATCFQFTDGSSQESVKVYIYIRQDNKEIVVSAGSSFSFRAGSQYMYIYYPNKNAYKAVLEISGKYYEVPLRQHEKLNGAFYFKGWDETIEDSRHAASGHKPVSNPEDRIVNLPSKIYTSEVNNPYFFPVLGVNTVGTGTIYAISSAAKALSQGQFGQFPLYAFSSEGVWALEVEMRQDANGIYNIGLYKAVQPITRDVCINTDSITQLDSSVLFATDRGIMLISGSNSICISDSLDYSKTFQITSLPQSDKLLAFVGFTQADLNYATFNEFVKGCRMLYSYNLQRIIVFNRNHPYAYVYSLKSKNWGMMPSTISHAIQSYPEALAQLEDGTIVDYSAVNMTFSTPYEPETGGSEEGAEEGTPGTEPETEQETEQETEPEQPTTTPIPDLTGIKGLLITRPLKLDAPDVLKTVDTVIQRGNFQRGHIKTAIYGSRDLINWFVVWTSVDHYLRGFRGTPYKYFRLVLLCDLDPTESVYGCTIQYTPRFTNRLR